MIPRLGLGVAVVGALLPWTVLRWATDPSPYVTFLDGPAFAYTAAALLLGGIALGAVDPWLGAFVVYTTLGALVTATDLALATAHWVAVGAAGLVLARRANPRLLVGVLVGAAVVQVGLAVVQRVVLGDALYAYGTFGNTKYLGTYLAVLTPLAPLWLAPVLLGGVVLSRSGIALAAVAAGLLARPRVAWPWRLGVAALGLTGALGVYLTRGATLDSLWSRLTVWQFALSDTTALTALVGRGPGAWHLTVPQRQVEAGLLTNDLFLKSHSDALQLAYEGGLVALVILGGWLWTHRACLCASPWRGAALAVALEALVLHPFHLPTVAPAAVAVLGLATREA